MRATQSHDTILEGAFIPDRHVQWIGKPGVLALMISS